MDYYEECKRSIQALKQKIENTEGIMNETLPLSSDYAKFIDWAVCTDCALKHGYFEMADERSKEEG